MTETAVRFSDNDFAQTLSGLLRERTKNAKDLARRIDCDPRAASEYRAGRRLPPLPVFVRMVAAFGRDLGEAIISPDTAIARLEAEVKEHEQRAEEARAALRAVAGAEAARATMAGRDRTAPRVGRSGASR